MKQLRLANGTKVSEREEDLTANAWAPKDYRKAIAQVGGLNEYGEPLYRVVLVSEVLEWHGGQHWDWPDNATFHDMGGMNFSDEMVERTYEIQAPTTQGGVTPDVQKVTVLEPEGMVPSTLKPIRVVVECRLVERYPHLEGWMLMRWRPASHWGSRENWDSHVYPGSSVSMLGPYPDRGRYESALEWADSDNGMHWTTWSSLPPISKVEEAVQFLEAQKAVQYGATPEVRMLIAMEERKQRIKAMAAKRSDERRAAVRDAIKPYLGSSQAAQRLRNELFERAGVREHVTI